MPQTETAQCVDASANMSLCDIENDFKGAAWELKPRVAFPTPDQDNEHHRRAKKLRTESPEVSVEASEYKQTDRTTSSRAWLLAVAKQLARWVQSCVSMNEKCQYIPLHVVIKLALAILRQTIKNNECDESPLCVYNLHALCSASFWIAIKFAAPRECLPGTSFMAMVVNINKRVLREAELHVLECINWDVYTLAKQHNLSVE